MRGADLGQEDFIGRKIFRRGPPAQQELAGETVSAKPRLDGDNIPKFQFHLALSFVAAGSPRVEMMTRATPALSGKLRGARCAVRNARCAVRGARCADFSALGT